MDSRLLWIVSAGETSSAAVLAVGTSGGAPMRLLPAALITHRAVPQAGALVLCVAPTLRQSAELVRKVIEFLRQAKVEFQGGKLGCELRNESRIVAVPGQEANVRGFSAPSLIVIDEAARVPDGGGAGRSGPDVNAVRGALTAGSGGCVSRVRRRTARDSRWRHWTKKGRLSRLNGFRRSISVRLWGWRGAAARVEDHFQTT